jgi:hypothetical protein
VQSITQTQLILFLETRKNVGKGIDMPKVILEENLFGKCDYCKKMYPIGDGLNFSYIESEKKWKCRKCEAEGVWA